MLVSGNHKLRISDLHSVSRDHRLKIRDHCVRISNHYPVNRIHKLNFRDHRLGIGELSWGRVRYHRFEISYCWIKSKIHNRIAMYHITTSPSNIHQNCFNVRGHGLAGTKQHKFTENRSKSRINGEVE